MGSYSDDGPGVAGSGQIVLERSSSGSYALRRVMRGCLQSVGKWQLS